MARAAATDEGSRSDRDHPPRQESRAAPLKYHHCYWSLCAPLEETKRRRRTRWGAAKQ